jgi:DNA-binding CsgD family transcriptional regulator
MTHHVDMAPMRDAEQLIDALNAASELEGGVEVRIESLLHSLHRMLGREGRSAIWLLDQLDRRPLPRIVARYVVHADWDPTPPQDLDALQRMIDDAAPLMDMLLPRILANVRTPFTTIVSEIDDDGWFKNVLLPKFLEPLGYADGIVSMWAASPSHAVLLGHLRRAIDPPFGDKDVQIMSLMLRAAAPMIDREVCQRASMFDQPKLSPRQHEVLLMLLAGESEKEIAVKIHRSVHTVHTFIRQIYKLFEVSSRGELMARFIDKAVFQLDSVSR